MSGESGTLHFFDLWGRLLRFPACVLGAVLPILALCGCDSTEENIELLDSPDSEVRQSASLRLLLIGESAVPGLLRVLAEGADSTRYIVVQLLGKIGDHRATESLSRILREEQVVPIREETAEALGKLGDDRAMAPLIDALREDEVPEVRVEAVRGLVNLRHADPAPLVAALNDWFPDVRKEALVGLVRLRHESEVDAELPRLTRDPDASVRYIAVQLLGRRRGEWAVPLLIAALEDEIGSVREEAAAALGRLGATEAIDALIDLMTRSTDPDGEAARRALREITGVDYRVVD